MKRLLALAVIGTLAIGTSLANTTQNGYQMSGQEISDLYPLTATKKEVHPQKSSLRKVIKLTTRHLPIHRYFVDDDDDDGLAVCQQYMIVRRDTAIVAHTDVSPTEDDIEISDGVKLRLWLVREKAMNAYRQKYQA